MYLTTTAIVVNITLVIVNITASSSTELLKEVETLFFSLVVD